jgi:hypothetical protein
MPQHPLRERELEATPVHLDFVEFSCNPEDRAVAPADIAPGLRETIAALHPTASDDAMKQRALAGYPSQLRALEHD